MKSATCCRCQTDVRLNEMVDLRGSLICLPCADIVLSDPNSGVSADELRTVADPTVCAVCAHDGGNDELPTVSGIPVCGPCLALARRRPFPFWLKASTVGLLIAACGALLLGRTYVHAEIAKIRAERLVQAKKYREASVLLDEVLVAAPKCKEAILLKLKSDILSGNLQGVDDDIAKSQGMEFKNEGLYLEVDRLLKRIKQAQDSLEKGLELVEQDRYNEALPHLELATKKYPESPHFRMFFLSCRSSIEFDKADYDAVLVTSREMAELDPDDAIAEAYVASATAAKFAVTGDAAWSAQAFEHLRHAETLVSDEDERAAFVEYRERIEHRLRTREIIVKAEYDRRFRS